MIPHLIAAAAALVTTCDLERPSGAPGCTREAVDALQINQLQAVGTHNSYKLAISAPEMALLAASAPDAARGLDYAHRPIHEQLDAGVRQLELDLFHDPEGGRYAAPLGLRLVPGAPAYDLAAMAAPGMKVMHRQDIDYRSSCATFQACLAQVKAWSDSNPDHVPLLILINLKEDAALPLPGAVAALAWDEPAMDAMDAEVRAVFGASRLITPDQVRGGFPTLREAVAAGGPQHRATGGWPVLGVARGKVMFALDAPRRQVDIYRGDRRSLEGRVMFVNIPETEDAAGYITLNEPQEQQARIQAAVKAGIMVRTRADADTAEARAGDTARREAAFASGAQYVSTDYVWPDLRFGDYQVELPGDGAARPNPVTAAK